MLVSLSMFPTCGPESISAEVAGIIDIIDRSGMPYKTSAMSTVIEGDWDQIMALVNKCRLTMLENHNRVYIVMTIDDRKGAKGRLEGKVKSLEDKLKRKLNK
jgi:uncharacterized protein (TIGR00106 family)